MHFPVVLAVDPSIVLPGIAVMQQQKLIAFGTIKLKSKDIEARYRELQYQLKNLIEQYNPEAMAVETQYLSPVMSNSIQKVSEMKGFCRGVFLNMRPNGKFYEVTPTQVKSALGIGRVSRAEGKAAAVKMARMMYPNVGKIDDNTADAIGVALATISQIMND